MIENVERYKNMDILKGLGIIYVVFGHTLVNPMHDFIYLFHMPLFYFVSGYFYNDKYTYNPIVLIKNRLKTLYVPFLKYELIFLLLHNVSFYLNIYSDKVAYKDYVMTLYSFPDFLKKLFSILTFGGTEQLLGAFWFFTVLFTINIMFCFIRYFLFSILKFEKEYPVIIIILSLFLIGHFLKDNSIELPRNLVSSFIAVMVFYLGFLYKKIEEKIPLNIFLSFMCICILCFATIFVKHPAIKQYFLSPLFFIIGALSGIYLNFYIAKILSRKNLRLLDFIGKNTIIIMGLHFLSFKIINLWQVHLFDYPIYMIASFPILYAENGWWILYAIAGLFIPISIKFIGVGINSLLKREGSPQYS